MHTMQWTTSCGASKVLFSTHKNFLLSNFYIKNFSDRQKQIFDAPHEVVHCSSPFRLQQRHWFANRFCGPYMIFISDPLYNKFSNFKVLLNKFLFDALGGPKWKSYYANSIKKLCCDVRRFKFFLTCNIEWIKNLYLAIKHKNRHSKKNHQMELLFCPQTS